MSINSKTVSKQKQKQINYQLLQSLFFLIYFIFSIYSKIDLLNEIFILIINQKKTIKRLQMSCQLSVYKIGCDKKCSKICMRSQQEEQKKRWKQEHKHEGFKYYEKVMKNINFVQEYQESQLLIITKEIQTNFHFFHQQLKKLQQKIKSKANLIFDSESCSSQQQNHQDYKIVEKINKLKNKDVNNLACKDVYQIQKYLQAQKTKINSLNGQTNKDKKSKFLIESKKDIQIFFTSLNYSPLEKDEIDKILQQNKKINKKLDQNEKQKSEKNQSYQRSLNEIIIDHSSYIQADQSSHLSRQQSQSSSIESFDYSSTIQYDSFERGIIPNDLGQSLHLSKIQAQIKPKKYKEKGFKKNKQIEQIDIQSEDQYIKQMVRDLGDQSTILQPEMIQEVPQQQNSSKNFEWQPSKYHKYVPNDLSQQQQLELALKMSEEVSTNINTTTQIKDQQYQYSSSQERYKKCSRSQSCSSNSEVGLMTIGQIAKMTDKLFTSLQKFDIRVKVISIIDVTLLRSNIMGNLKSSNNRYRYKIKFFGSDQTGCSIFYIDYSQRLKIGMSIHLYNCFIVTYAEYTNYEILSYDKRWKILSPKLQITKPNFSIMLSRLNHVKGKWNYEVRNNHHFKVMEVCMLNKRNGNDEIYLSKNVIVSVLKKISQNQYLVGDYTGTVLLYVQSRHLKKSDIKQKDSLNIIRGVVQISKSSFEEDQFEINTNHQRCIVYNLRNHNIKFHEQFIPSFESN